MSIHRKRTNVKDEYHPKLETHPVHGRSKQSSNVRQRGQVSNYFGQSPHLGDWTLQNHLK